MERIELSKKELLRMEHFIRKFYHVQRYFIIRQFCWGRVLDIACGVGYGSYIISTNLDVSAVMGIDQNSDAITYANVEYASEKVSYHVGNVESCVFSADVLVSIETIEHLFNPFDLGILARKSNVKDVIVSYPTKKSTNYNPFHTYDLHQGDILKIFDGFRIINTIKLQEEVEILVLTKSYDHGISTPRKRM